MNCGYDEILKNNNVKELFSKKSTEISWKKNWKKNVESLKDFYLKYHYSRWKMFFKKSIIIVLLVL